MKNNIKIMRQTLKARSSVMAGRTLECNVSYCEGISTAKLVQFCLGIIELQIRETALSYFLYYAHLFVACPH